jgi:hypothetical protein
MMLNILKNKKMENLKNEIKKESSEDSLILYQSNLLQIKLADEL